MSVNSVRKRLAQVSDAPWSISADGYDILDRNGVQRATARETWATNGDVEFIVRAPDDLWLALDVIAASERLMTALKGYMFEVGGMEVPLSFKDAWGQLHDAWSAFEQAP